MMKKRCFDEAPVQKFRRFGVEAGETRFDLIHSPCFKVRLWITRTLKQAKVFDFFNIINLTNLINTYMIKTIKSVL